MSGARRDYLVDDERQNILSELGFMMALPPRPTRNRVNKGLEALYVPYRIESRSTSRKGDTKRGIKIVSKNSDENQV